MNTICVQDPMLVSHNVADLVDYKSCKKFFKEIMIACKLLQDNTNFTPSSSKWGLLTLLDKRNEYLLRNLVHQKTECFPIPLLNKYVIDQFANEDKTLMTAQNLLHLLKYILLFECRTLGISDVMNLLKKHDEIVEQQRKVLDSVHQKLLESQEFVRVFRKHPKKQLSTEKTTLSETPMLEEFQKFNSEHKLILAAECKVLKNTWLGRDFVPVESFTDHSLYGFIEKERHISLEASKQNELNIMEEKMKSFMFFFEVYLSPKEPESLLLINFRPFRRTNFNPILGMFLKEYVQKLIKNLNEIS